MDRAAVMRWVAGYERAWRASDAGAVERLFAPDAEYRRSPVEPSLVGHAAIGAMWTEDDGECFAFTAEPVAVEGDRAVVRAHVTYARGQAYVDLWVLRFAPDGRVREFEEWPYWPGRGHTAERNGAGP